MATFKLVKGDPDKSFFSQNPELRYLTPVKDLIEKEGVKKAGRIMWAIYMVEDLNSTLYHMPQEDKKAEVKNNYLKDPDFEWDEYSDLIAAYPDLAMSVEARNYKRLNDKFQSMLDNVEGADLKAATTFYKSLKSIYEGLEYAKKMYDEEMSKQTEYRGSEQGGFFNQ